MSSLPYFFFGTLMDAEVRAIVLGGALEAITTEAASLEGYARLCVAKEIYPTLRPARGQRVHGLVVHGLAPEDERRIAYFEGVEYELVPKHVRLPSGAEILARLFLDPGDLRTSGPWDFAQWQQRDKSALLEAARHFMKEFEVGAGRTTIDARWRAAWSRAKGPVPKG